MSGVSPGGCPYPTISERKCDSLGDSISTASPEKKKVVVVVAATIAGHAHK
jgi:hypothetical protein